MTRSTPLLLLALGLPTAAGGQATVMTGGGVARLDQFGTGPMGTIGLEARQQIGGVAFELVGNTTNYQSFGTTNRVAGRVDLGLEQDGWIFGLRPEARFGSGVTRDWNRSLGGTASLAREIGPLLLEVAVGEGLTRPQEQRVTWGTRSGRGRMSIGAVTFEARWEMTRMRDSALRDDVFYDPNSPPTPDQFQSRVRDVEDASIAVTWNSSRLSLDAVVGYRTGDAIMSSTWYRLEAALPVTAAASLVLTTARHPADVVLGLRGGRATTLGLELALPSLSGRVNSLPPLVSVERESARRVRVVLTLPTAISARLMGEITGWRPVDLAPLGDGRFVGWLTAPRGTYRINVSVDQGPWIAPPGIPDMHDDFGGMVGLLEL